MTSLNVKLLDSEKDIFNLQRADIVRGVLGPKNWDYKNSREPFNMAFHGTNFRGDAWEFLFFGDSVKGFPSGSIEVYAPQKDNVFIREGMLYINEEISRFGCVINTHPCFEEFYKTLLMGGLVEIK